MNDLDPETVRKLISTPCKWIDEHVKGMRDRHLKRFEQAEKLVNDSIKAHTEQNNLTEGQAVFEIGIISAFKFIENYMKNGYGNITNAKHHLDNMLEDYARAYFGKEYMKLDRSTTEYLRRKNENEAQNEP